MIIAIIIFVYIVCIIANSVLLGYLAGKDIEPVDLDSSDVLLLLALAPFALLGIVCVILYMKAKAAARP